MSRFLFALLVVLFAVPTFAAPVPKSLRKKQPLRATIEPRPGEAVYTVVIQDAPFGKVAEALEAKTGLMFIAKDKPEGLKITLHAENVCLAELFAQLDDILYPQGWVVPRRKASFCTLAVKDVAQYSSHFSPIDFNELGRRSQYEPVQITLDVDTNGLQAGLGQADGMKENGFQVRARGTDKLLVQGQAKDVRKLVDDLGDHVKK